MEKIYWENKLDKNELSKFFRDLSEFENLNVKDLYEKSQIKPIVHNKKKHKSKKDIIIENANKNKENKFYLDDNKKIYFFLNNYDDINKLINNIRFLKTDKGKIEFKLKIIEKAYKKQELNILLELYLQIYDKITDESQKKYLKKIEKKLEKFNYKSYIMENLSNKLPPLDLYNNYEKKLEQWQIDVINNMKNNKSIIVSAPTSSGKSFLAIYSSMIFNKILYIVPSKPLAYQIGGVFNKLIGDKVSIIVDDKTYYTDNKHIIVGTPLEIEKRLYKLNLNFDFVVYDEIHNLNYFEGDSLERIIKLLKCNFLALSATINNMNDLHKWWCKIHKHLDIKKVEYESRFINLQRYIFNNNKLEYLHPFNCIEKEDLEYYDKYILPFTPKDCIKLYEQIKKYNDYEYIKHIDPDVFFDKEKVKLTLEDSKKYEIFIKNEFKKLDNRDVILKSFYKEEIKYELNNDNIINFVNELQLNKMTPSIIFNMDKHNCKNFFTNMVKTIEKEELLEYPYWYEILEFKNNCYKQYLEKKEEFLLKLTEKEKDSKINNFEDTEQSNFEQIIYNYYERWMRKIGIDPTKTIEEKKKQIKNLTLELKSFKDSPKLKEVDIFMKHPKYNYNNRNPMDRDEIKEIRKKIIKNLNSKIEYEHLLIQGLKRGIGLYTDDMPDIYKNIVQSLSQQKKLGIIISDESLALGINMPIRSTIILGYNNINTFDNLIYQQMIGRSGRRGLDVEGNIIYVNVSWKKLMKGKPNNIIGKKSKNNYYFSLDKISNINQDEIKNIFKNFLNGDNNFYNTKKIINDINEFNNDYEYKLIWKLKEYKYIIYFTKILDRLNLILKKPNYNIEDELYLLKLIIYIFIQNNPININNIIDNDEEINNLLNIYKLKKINDNIQFNKKIYFELGYILKNIYNILIDNYEFKFLLKIIYTLFNNIKNVVNKVDFLDDNS